MSVITINILDNAEFVTPDKQSEIVTLSRLFLMIFVFDWVIRFGLRLVGTAGPMIVLTIGL